MKACFAHDTVMTRDNKGNVFSSGSFPYSVWKRYLKHFDEITVLSRESVRINTNSEKKENNLSLSSGPNTKFISIPNLSSIRGKLLNKRSARKIIENELKHADILIARLPSEIGTLAIDVAINKGLPYLIEVVGCTYDAYRYYGNIKGKLYAPISILQMRKKVKNSKYTIYVTKEYLQNRYPTMGSQVNISDVNIKEIDENMLSERLKTVDNIGDKKLKIGMIGTLNSKYKGFDKAIEYLSVIKPNNNNYELYILGAGNQKHFDDVITKTDMKSKVFFDGTRSSGEEVFKWLDNIDLYIQPSLTEGLPRALIEALSRGCLAIGSERGGIPELLKAEYLFNPLDKESLNYAIKNSLFSNENMKKQVKTNIEKAQEYTIFRLEKKRDDFIRKFISENEL